MAKYVGVGKNRRKVPESGVVDYGEKGSKEAVARLQKMRKADKKTGTTAPQSPAPGDKGPGYATLVNKEGHRKAVKVNSPESKEYFAKGYELETQDMAAKSEVPTGEEPALDFTPEGEITGEDFEAAYGDPDKMTALFGQMLERSQEYQEDVVDTRASQKGYEETLEISRRTEDVMEAKSYLEEKDKELKDMRATMANIENNVRKDLGPMVSESLIQAEVTRRTEMLEPKLNRLIADREYALNRLQLNQAFSSERFEAIRADAQEAVDRVMQKYGFNKENMNTAFTLMTNLKQFEIANDEQRTAEKEEGRAVISWLISQPGALNRLTESQLDSLSAQAKIPRSSLSSIQSTLSEQKNMIGDPILDDSGNLNYLTFNPNTNTFQSHRIPNFATVSPLSGGDMDDLDSFVNASKEWRTEYSNLTKAMNDAFIDKDTKPEERQDVVFKIVTRLSNMASQTGEPADWEATKDVANMLLGAGISGGSTSAFERLFNEDVR